jgi:phosphatidate phosphatase APP1
MASDTQPSEIKQWLHDTAWTVEQAVDTGWRRLSDRLGLNRPLSIQPYHGWANGQRLRVMGRVLSNKPRGGPKEDDGWWDNLLATYQRWESDEAPDVGVRLTLDGRTFNTRTDEEGYISFDLPLDEPLPGDTFWHEGTLSLTDPKHATGPDGKPVTAGVGILVPPPGARTGVISDMDDTVLHTGVTHLLTTAKLTFLHNARTRKPLHGVSRLYQAFHHGPAGPPQQNPLFYVSSSPWNLYDLICDFLDLNKLPIGPLLLRDLGIDEHKLIKTDHGHKLVKAQAIIDSYPDLQWVLVGDSGQHDAFLYLEAAQRQPEKIKAIYIRDVDPDVDSDHDQKVHRCVQQCEDLGVPMLLVPDSRVIAEHAAGLGLVDRQAIDEVAQEAHDDKQRPSTAAEAAGLA